MKPSTNQLAKLLTYCGTLPLIACVALLIAPVPSFNSSVIANTYSAIIISFLCGIHWAVYLFFAEKCTRNLLITSNTVALLAWSSLLVMQNEIALLIQILCFLYLLTLDFKLYKAGVLPEWFYGLRRNATIIVVLSLTAIIGLS